MRQAKVSKWIYTAMAAIALVLNVIAWVSPSFCDAYLTYVFPIWLNTYGRLTGLFRFSVGEWMIVAGVLLLIPAVLLLPVGAVLFLSKRSCRRVRNFYVFLGKVLILLCLVMTLNCSLLYHATPFWEVHFGQQGRDYSLEDCIRVYNRVAAECNRLSEEVPRDSEGRPDFRREKRITEGDRRSEEMELSHEAIRCMQALGKDFERLDGWYPFAKPMFFSDLMCQMYMAGYYFPFSLEANYNRVMERINKPAAICHELAHVRGYLYEDEANFIAYMACLETEEPLFEYSGYLSVLPYLIRDLNHAAVQEPELYQQAVGAEKPIELAEQVEKDDVFVREEEWERIHRKSLLDTETVDRASDVFTDTVLKLNGVSDGMVSYSRVVELMMQYYRLTK